MLISNNGIDSRKASEIVRSFLSQCHAVHDVKEPSLDDHAWTVEAEVATFGANQVKRVKLDTESGKIISCHTMPNPKTHNP